MEMRAKLNCFSQHTGSALFLFLLYLRLSTGQTTPGYTCSDDPSIYPCRTYVHFLATPPNLLSLPAIADLFNVSPLMISMASNLSSSTTPLLPHQSLLIPVTCSCNSNHSHANLSYQIKPGDTFYILSTLVFQNLTTYQAIELANAELVPTLLQIGSDVVVPAFCRCANKTHLRKEVNYFITYVIQPSDDVSSIAKRFGSDKDLLASTNGVKANKLSPYKTILVPVLEIPRLTQPAVSAPSPENSKEREAVKDLAVALAIVSVVCMVLAGGVAWYWWPNCLRYRLRGKVLGNDKELVEGGINVSLPRESFMATVSDCLDKYKVFGIEELRKSTMGFDDEFMIGGTVYKGSLRGELYAVKLLKWNASEELKILQKVNHHNLVRLEGFCIDNKDGNCYLVYEYVENGSLHSWMHGIHRPKKLEWKTRLQIAVDVANGLQYIHEHTRPRVVHKDIKSSNILLDSKMRAKIANFGLAKSGCNAVTVNIMGTQGYLAPEYLMEGLVTSKMDVFAFGVVLLELISGKEAAGQNGELLWMELEKVFESDNEKKLTSWMDLHLVQTCSSMESVANVMAAARACVQRDPSKRPSMVDIVYMLCKADELYFDFSEDGLLPGGVMARFGLLGEGLLITVEICNHLALLPLER